jgi:hypothetical protein
LVRRPDGRFLKAVHELLASLSSGSGNKINHLRTTRMPSLAVYGDSSIGRDPCSQENSLSAREKPHRPKARLLVVELAGRPNERRLFAQILAVLDAPSSETIKPGCAAPFDQG